MAPERSLFDPTIGMVHTGDPNTSREAAASVSEKLRKIQTRVRNILIECGPLSGEQVHAEYQRRHGGIAYSTARTRMTELKTLGYIRDSGVRRKNSRGNNEAVLEVVKSESS